MSQLSQFTRTRHFSKRTLYTSGSGTFTPQSGTNYFLVIGMGGGGGGGGGGLRTATLHQSYSHSGGAGGAGGAGGFGAILLPNTASSYPYVVGAGGTGGAGKASTQGNGTGGTAGGDTIFYANSSTNALITFGKGGAGSGGPQQAASSVSASGQEGYGGSVIIGGNLTHAGGIATNSSSVPATGYPQLTGGELILPGGIGGWANYGCAVMCADGTVGSSPTGWVSEPPYSFIGNGGGPGAGSFMGSGGNGGNGAISGTAQNGGNGSGYGAGGGGGGGCGISGTAGTGGNGSAGFLLILELL